MSEYILETEDLTKEFAGFVAVNGVNLRVERGTIHALIGPNGAGKTTCFNLLTKFLQPTRGRCFRILRRWRTSVLHCSVSAAVRSTSGAQVACSTSSTNGRCR
jgi:ABC-type branched-subunit amino acid transport system ATPase component